MLRDRFNWLVPPFLDRHAQAQMVRILTVLLGSQVFVGLALIFVFGLNDDRFWFAVTIVVHGALCMVLTQRGAMFLPRTTTPAVWLGSAIYLAYCAYGVHDIAFSLVPIAMVCAAFVQGRGGLLITTGAGFIAAAALVHAEVSGIFTTKVSQFTDYMDLAYLTMIYAVACGALWALVGFWSALAERSHKQTAELVRQQATLRASEERFRAIADYTVNWESWIGSDGSLLWVNPAVERVTGYSVEMCMEMDDYPEPLVHPEDRNHVREFMRQSGSRSDSECEFRVLRKDGEISWGALSRRQVTDESGDAGFRTSVRDITDRKRSDEKQADLKRQLDRAQRMEAIGQLAGGIAHDFNNLLLAIRGNSELLLEDGLDPENRVFAEEISRASDRAAELTGQLLAFSRRQVIKPIPTDINALIEELTGMLTRLIPETIHLEFQPNATSPVVAVDPAHLEQIIVNLVINARDAMANGGTLVIETLNASSQQLADGHQTPIPGECLVIRVADTGVGMSPEIRDRIFEPFFTTKPKGEGTGLGLSTVFGLVKQHKGVTRVHSEEGVGTEFRIFLPLSSEPAQVVESHTSSRLSTGSGTILVVEDEPMVLRLACEILNGAGYTTIQCSNGQEACDRYSQHSSEIDLVLTDVVMPVVGGEEVMHRLRAIDPNVRILFTSGYPADGIHTGFILNSGLDLISKPYSPRELLERVHVAMNQQSDVASAEGDPKK